VVAVAAFALLAGCGGDSADLRALKDDPLARYEPPGGRLIHSNERSEGSTFGKPYVAEYSRMFELPPGDREEQLQHAVDAAVAAGWTLVGGGPHPHRFMGELIEIADKQLPNGGAHLSLTVFPNGPPSEWTDKPAIYIHLRHRGS